MKSPGDLSLRRDVERLFWRELAKGFSHAGLATAIAARKPVCDA